MNCKTQFLRKGLSKRIFAFIAAVCMVFTLSPPVAAAEGEDFGAKTVLSGFAALPNEVREQSVTLGTPLGELKLPDTLEATVSSAATPPAEDSPTVGTSENAGQDNTDKTVIISGVTWESDPLYDSEVEGTYTFTAVLPSGYTVEDGIAMPEITVVVGQAEQSAVDKVTAMIDALPTMDEWTAMDDAAARAAMDEILAAKKAYDALTNEEKAQIDEARTAKLLELAEMAEQLAGMTPMAATDFGTNCTWEVTAEGVLILAPKYTSGGTLPSFGAAIAHPWNSQKAQIVAVKVDSGVIANEDSKYLFFGLTNCASMDLSGLDTSKVKFTQDMFGKCSSLTSLDVSNFNTENLTDINLLFRECSRLSSLDLSKFDFTKVTSTTNTFYDCTLALNTTFYKKNMSGKKLYLYDKHSPADLTTTDLDGTETNIVFMPYTMTKQAVTGGSFSMTGSRVTADDYQDYFTKTAPLYASNAPTYDSTKNYMQQGEAVTITLTPDNGYVVDTVTVKNSDNSDVTLSGTGNTRTFTMPAGDVSIAASFKIPGLLDNPLTQEKVDLAFGTGNATLAGNTITLNSNVVLNHTVIFDGVTATLDTKTFTITGKAGDSGSTGRNGSIAITINSSAAVTITGDVGGNITGGKGGDSGVVGGYGGSGVTGNVTLSGGVSINGGDCGSGTGGNDGDGGYGVQGNVTISGSAAINGGTRGIQFSGKKTAVDGTITAGAAGIAIRGGDFGGPINNVIQSGDTSDYPYIKVFTAYTITKTAATHGSFTVKVGASEVTSAAAGETVTITLTPASGAVLDTLTVKNADNSDVTLLGTGNTRTFIMPAGDVTIAATFKLPSYTVTLNGDGGTGTALSSYTYSVGATLPTDWTKIGYTFGGWYDNSGFTGSAVTAISATDTGDKEYWAKWEIISVSGVSLNKTSTTLVTGETEALTATVLPDDAPNKSVTWGSSNTGVATVANGAVTAVDAGTATITVTTVDGSKTATCIVTVNKNDAQLVAAAKAAAENAAYAATTQSATGTESDTNTYVQNIATTAVNNSGVTVTVNKVSYTAPVAGTSADPDGTDGSYVFTITVSKGLQSQTTTQKTVVITATPYTGMTDAEAVAAAKAAAENAVYAATTQAATGAESDAKTYAQDIAATAVNNSGVTVTVNKVSYTAPVAGTAANPNGTNGSYSFTITVSKGSQSQTTKQITIVITATAYTGSTGGSGSGNSGSSGSGDGGSSTGGFGGGVTGGATTPPTSKPTGPVTGNTENKATVDDKGNANVNITDKNIADAIASAKAAADKKSVNAGEILAVINVTTGGKEATTVSVNLPKVVQEKVIGDKITKIELVIDRPDLTIGMNLPAVTEINKQAKADVQISASKTNAAALSAEAKAAIGNRPAYNLSATYQGGGKSVTNFGAGNVSIEIPYKLQSGENAGNICAVYVDKSGKVTYLLNSSYDSRRETLVFTTNHFSVYGVGFKATSPKFTDTKNHWAKDSVDFVVSRGLMNGTGATTFSPNEAMTRGMLAAALGRLSGADVSGYKASSFSDVSADSQYMGYIEWANKNNIMAGVKGGKFAPDGVVTREQMADIMLRYAKAVGYSLPEARESNTFADNLKISAGAAQAVKRLQMAGVIAGKTGNVFDPQGKATRAEVSAVLKRFVELAAFSNMAQGWAMNDSGRWMYYKNRKAVNGKNTIDGTAYTFNSFGEIADTPKKLT